MTTTGKSLLNARVTEAACGGQIVAAASFAEAAAFMLTDGAIVHLSDGGAVRRFDPKDEAAVLVASADAKTIVAGRDDGRVVSFDASGDTRLVADEKGRWIDALAMRPDGALAWSVGKEVRARDARGEIRTLTAPSTVRGLFFFPKGYRLALACYNCVLLWFPNLATAPESLDWRGSHLSVTVSPDSRFVISAMQENALHGWRVVDRKNMRMTGYPAKTRSFSWSGDGDWLATSGAEACIIWPFAGKDGPMGKPPNECGARPARVSQVACHPKAPMVAVGYDDGWIMLCRLDSSEEAVIRAISEPEAGAISALTWSSDGRSLIYGTRDGVAGIAVLP